MHFVFGLKPRGMTSPSRRRDHVGIEASPSDGRLATTDGRIEFVAYGLVVRLPVLPTSPRGDAVPVGYRIKP